MGSHLNELDFASTPRLLTFVFCNALATLCAPYFHFFAKSVHFFAITAFNKFEVFDFWLGGELEMAIRVADDEFDFGVLHVCIIILIF